MLLDNLCVHADSSHNFVIALIMPNWRQLKNIAAAFLAEQAVSNGTQQDSNNNSEIDLAKQMRTNPAFVARVQAAICQFCTKETKLSRVEIPERIYICAEEWTPDNNLLTAAMKIKRINILRFYAKEIERMYAE